jgi:DeoR/GlpR family transcriptional regulator of sugar metabolism
MNTRQSEILDLLQKKERVTVRALAEHFKVSPMTIRRDLAELEERSFLIRTHGGGLPTTKLRLLQRAFPNFTVSAEKEAIGKLAASQVGPGQTIMVDSGTTALEVARNLPRNFDLTIATTSIWVAQELYGSSLRLVLFGGFMREGFPSTYGPQTEAMLKEFHAHVLFIGCDGADSRNGFYTNDLLTVGLEQQMMSVAERVILVAESAKFTRKALVRYATADQVDVVVTDSSLSSTDRKNLEKQGVTILVAEEEEVSHGQVRRSRTARTGA